MAKQPTPRDKRSGVKRRTTSYLPWNTARRLIRELEQEGKYNTALMVSAGVHFGLRISDTLRLTWGQIRGAEIELVEQKTGKFRRIQVHKDFAALRDRYLADRFYDDRQPEDAAHVFTPSRGRQRNKPITVRAANKRFATALQRHGIETANASTHTLRKTFARRVWEKRGKSESALVLLSEMLNHRGTAVTRKYLGITSDEIAEVYADL